MTLVIAAVAVAAVKSAESAAGHGLDVACVEYGSPVCCLDCFIVTDVL